MHKDYEKKIDLADPNNPHTKMIEMVGRDKRVVDFGCSTGFVARVLKERGCAVTGVEVDPRSAEAAREVCERVIVGDLETLDLGAQLEKGSYDVCLFGDVIEHLKNPGRVLIAARGLLAEGGYIVLSVPNITHASIRLMLLEGRFDYSETGILDDTHLRFFTRESIVDLLESCGYAVDVIDSSEQRVSGEQLRSVLDPLGLADLEEVVKSFSSWEAAAFQYVIKAFPASDGDRVRRLSEEKVRSERRLRDLEREVGELRKAAEHLRGLEDGVEKKNAYIRMLERELSERDRRLAEKDRRIEELTRTAALRVGPTASRPRRRIARRGRDPGA